MSITKPGVAWILAIAGTAGGAYVAYLTGGHGAAIAAVSAACMSAAGLLGYQAKGSL